MMGPLEINLDDQCGRHFRYRDLIEVGATWKQNWIDNRPREPATYEAMTTLCAEVLDPVYERFGSVELTYGFVSPELEKRIRKNPNPNTTRDLDQHAGCELNRRGKPFCPRLGLAVDFRCPDVGSTIVAAWVVENTSFDRLYFYNDDRPFHVSIGPQGSGQITLMQRSPSGRLMPRRVSKTDFTQMLSAARPA